MNAIGAEKRARIVQMTEELQRRKQQRLFHRIFPAHDRLLVNGQTIHARSKYPKHLEFFRAGKTYRERCCLAATRGGKTWTGAYELTCHLTGLYPDWWEGRRFATPIRAWAAGRTNETTRDIVQSSLVGEIAFAGGRKTVTGTGMIPGELIGQPSWKAGVPDLLDTVKVKHVSGRFSTLGLKSYQQGRGSFEGTAQHVIWVDEECPVDIYVECVIRTATTNGLIMLTFTPLLGLTETVLQFMTDDNGERRQP
jgi:phage terminase large subunit-like protein